MKQALIGLALIVLLTACTVTQPSPTEIPANTATTAPLAQLPTTTPTPLLLLSTETPTYLLDTTSTQSDAISTIPPTFTPTATPLPNTPQPTKEPTRVPDIINDPSLPLPTGQIFMIWDPKPPEILDSGYRKPFQYNLYQLIPGKLPTLNVIKTDPSYIPNWFYTMNVSPDQRKIAFLFIDDTNENGKIDLSGYDEDSQTIHIYDIASETLKPLASGDYGIFFTSWMPDSQGILYPQGEDVILAEIDESLNQIFSTIQNYFINQATISPDGKWLVLYGGFPGPQVMAFQVGKQEAAILADNMLRDMKKTLWSPDGSLLAFGQHGNSFFRPLSLFNTETEEFTVSVASPEDIVSVPSWSPDGQWLAFTTNQTALSFWNRNDQLVTEILTGTLVSPPLWSPISNQFAVGFVNDNQGKLVVADIDNKNMQEWDIGDDIQDVRVLGWSPDGNWIAFTTLGNESSGLYIAPMQGKEIYLMVDITEGDVIERFVWVPTP